MLVELKEVIKLIEEYRDSDKITETVSMMVLTGAIKIIKEKFNKDKVLSKLDSLLSKRERWDKLDAILTKYDEELERLNTCGISLSKNEIIQQQENILIKTSNDIERLYLGNDKLQLKEIQK